ncbi:F-box protein At5g07610-like [Durio zibethinus]|uniref:F-box protein At5g07610-like n=1 Tax=Durio zibethinus TaxID=66656 RepID=A0A6P5WSF5_DURZI|nr:F-box protein At5g07610-like [Durio zibethinus]XP_022718769.1 F-box protein At5g07610-like [Durio zibethinus]
MKKKTSIILNSAAAETIAYNQDLLTIILLRLPTKSLIKFKCVSRQWLSIISDPDFCLSHTRHHHSNGSLSPTALLLKGDCFTPPSEFSIVPLKHYSKVPFFHYIHDSDVRIVQSCNGLLLCESYRQSYLICNPTTKSFRRLYCPSNSYHNFLSKFCVNLAFDPLSSPDYKIICVWESYREPSKFNLDLYSSKIGSWDLSIITFEVDEDEFIELKDGVFCNGRIHWCGYGSESLYFDVENECLETMPMALPTRMDADEECRYFGESRGVLYLAVTYSMAVCLELDVFEMARDYSQWNWKIRLNLGDAVKVFPELELGCVEYCPGFSGVCFIPSEKEEEPKVVLWADGKIICFDFMEGAWKKLYDLGPGIKIGSLYLGEDDHLHYERFHTYQYFENLSCL